MRRAFIAILTAFSLAVPTEAQVAGEGATDIVRYYGTRAALIQLVGERANHKVELASQGSGLLLDDRHVLTNDHVVPDVADRYLVLTLNVRLEKRVSEPIRAKVVARDTANDLALLELETPQDPPPFCPVSALMPPALLSEGSLLYLMGFPLDRKRTVAPGLLGSADDGGLWQTDAPLNPGYSGSPAFSSKGYLVAVAVSGVVDYRQPNGTVTEVQGINDLVPVSRLATSPVGAWLKTHSSSGCWREVTALPTAAEFGWVGSAPNTVAKAQAPAFGESPRPTIAATGVNESVFSTVLQAGVVGVPTTAIPTAQAVPSSDAPMAKEDASPSLPDSLSIDLTFSEMKDDHGLTENRVEYRKVFAAQAGYLIDQCEYSITSANRERGVRCVVASDRKSATLEYSLASGPAYDRWRGWLSGTVSLSQQREELITGLPIIDRKIVRVSVEQYRAKHGLLATERNYAKRVRAPSGYSVTDCSFEELSANHADGVRCTVDPDRKSATLTFRLRSGPAFDRWRGWLNGSIVLSTAKSN